MDVNESHLFDPFLLTCWYYIINFKFSSNKVLFIFFSLKEWVLLPEDKYNKRLAVVSLTSANII